MLHSKPGQGTTFTIMIPLPQKEQKLITGAGPEDMTACNDPEDGTGEA